MNRAADERPELLAEALRDGDVLASLERWLAPVDERTAPFSATSGEPPDTADGMDATLRLEAAEADSVTATKHVDGNGAARRQSKAILRAGEFFAGYCIIKELAAGGMGIVYLARQEKLNRLVALKTIRSGAFANREEISRFYNEAEAAANLSHEGIVPIFEVGEQDGIHFFSMDYVQGESLRDRISEGTLKSRDAAEIVLAVCEAIEHAHQKAILHRDLKPSNVLLDEDGRPRVTDFGLAKRIGGDGELTVTGQVLGTAGYMPPEQACGDQARLSPASDVYSLGATLFAMLTGQAPFRGTSPFATLQLVMSHDPVRPRLINPSVDVDLENICLKCLEKDPGRRYASAGGLGEELRRYLAGQPVRARPIGWTRRVWRWCLRNPAVASLLALVMFVLVAGTVLSTALAIDARRQAALAVAEQQRADRERETAKKEREIAEGMRKRATNGEAIARREAEKARENLYVAQMTLAGQALREGQTRKVRTILEETRPTAGMTDPRGFEWGRLRQEIAAPYRMHHIQGGLTQEGEYPRDILFADGDRAYLVAFGRHVYLYESESGELLRKLPSAGFEVHQIALSPDGALLVAATGAEQGNGQAVLWRRQTGERNVLAGDGRPVLAVAFSPDGERLALGTADLGKGFTGPSQRFAVPRTGKDGRVLIYDASTHELLTDFAIPTAGVISLAWSPGGERIAVGGPDGIARVCDTDTGEIVHRLEGQVANVWSLAYSPDGSMLAAGSGEFITRGVAVLWDAAEGTELGRIDAHAGGVFSLDFSPDGRLLATGGWDKTIHLWNVGDRRPDWRGAIRGHHGAILGLDFSSDGAMLASCSQAPRSTVSTYLDTPDAAEFAQWRVDRQIEAYDISAGEQPPPFPIPVPRFLRDQGKFVLVDFSSGKRHVFARTTLSLASKQFARLDETGRKAVVVDLQTGDQLAELQFSESRNWIQFTPDGKTLLCSGASGVEMLEPISGEVLLSLPVRDTTSLEVSFDGRTLLCREEHGNATGWNLQSGQPAELPPDLAFQVDGGHTYDGQETLDTWLSRDGRFRAVATRDFGKLTLYDHRRGERHVCPVSDRWIRTVDFTADGSLLAACGYGLKTILWDLHQGRAVAELGSGPAPALALSPDDALLATGGDDALVRLWNVGDHSLHHLLRGHTEVIWQLAFSPEGDRLATSSWDRTVKLWDPRLGRLIATYASPRGPRWESHFSSDGRLLISLDTTAVTVERADAW